MTVPVNTIICGSDTKERKQWFKGASFAHPAKMHLSLQLYLIEHYTNRGETILDPMTGSGTVLVACALERNVICVELEKKFVDMQTANWSKIKALGPMLGYKMGNATILQGDARQLNDLLVDKCIFSPPYAPDSDPRIREKLRPGRTGPIGTIPSDNSDNIANLPYGKISTVITSPPHGNRLSDAESKDGDPQRMSYRQALAKADAVITSPPYAESLSGGGIAKKGYQGPKHSPTDLIGKRSYTPEQAGQSEGQISNMPYADLDPSIKRLRKHGRTDDKAGGPYGRSLGHPYSGAVENIGNLKSENYLSAMLQVYQQCHKALKAGGLMVLVTKNFIRNKKIVQLDLDTIKLCEQAGFVLKERLQRKLIQQSFWRIIYHQKYPDVPKIEFEDVLIFSS